MANTSQEFSTCYGVQWHVTIRLSTTPRASLGWPWLYLYLEAHFFINLIFYNVSYIKNINLKSLNMEKLQDKIIK
jgi:hypothetical protein